ncbi:FMN-binding protein [Athalassotoga saccharophila]|uniref:FMN-binding protein n=1 Tax=Athalassotoga saccharophila TaxID=1441386 RepID=UPI00137944F6|nr:FMN-binding protein [Athalassotoga saccharophila]BBJ27569.1 electron transport complex protein RnfG [Athalassotoga saccharophila]
MSNHIKVALILTVVMVIIGIGLAGIYLMTYAPIAKADLNADLEAIKFVLTDQTTGQLLVSQSQIPQTMAELNAKIWKSDSSGVLYSNPKLPGYVLSPAYLFKGKDGSNIYVLTGYGIGFGGRVVTVASFIQQKDGSFLENSIDVIDYSNETPGLGAKINDPDVRSRFFDIPNSGLKDGVKVNKDAGLFPLPANYLSKINQYKAEGIVVTSDVMTGATITPRSVANTLNAMYEFLEKEVK